MSSGWSGCDAVETGLAKTGKFSTTRVANAIMICCRIVQQYYANTTPRLSFLCDGLKRFSEDEHTCLQGIFLNFTFKELLQILQLSLGRLSDISSLTCSLDRSISVSHKVDKYTCVSVFVGSKFLASGKNKIDVHWLLAHFGEGVQ